MLDARAELGKHVTWHVFGRLGHEDDADPLRADETHCLRDRVEKVPRRVLEQQVCLVEEEHEFRFVEVTDLRKVVEEVGEQPHEKGRVEFGLVLHPGHFEQADDAAAVRVDPQEISGVDLRLAEKYVGSLIGERDQLAQDHANGGTRQAAEAGELTLSFGTRQIAEHGAQVGEVDERESRPCRVVEDEAERGLLRAIEAENF